MNNSIIPYTVGRQVGRLEGRPLFSYMATCPNHPALPAQHQTRAVTTLDGRQQEIEVCWNCGRIQKVQTL